MGYLEERRARKLGIADPLPSRKEPKLIAPISEKRKQSIAAERALFSADKAFYKEIWDASPHVCQSCDCKLGKEPRTFYFHHLLKKSVYPQFRHTPENIMILCLADHNQAEIDLDKVPKVKARTLEAEKILLT